MTTEALAIQVVRLPHGSRFPLPMYQTGGAAGMDLVAALDEPLSLAAGQTAKIPSGIAVAIPEGFEGQIRPRSGLASSLPLILPNSPGTIDSDYRGEIKVLMTNIGRDAVLIEPGMRVAQLVIAPVARAEWRVTDALPGTDRADGGFGHTGT